MLKRGESKRCEFFAADFLIIFASICTGNQQTNLSFGTKRSILSETKKRKGNQIALILITNPQTNMNVHPKYKALLKFRNIPFEADLFTWHNEDL